MTVISFYYVISASYIEYYTFSLNFSFIESMQKMSEPLLTTNNVESAQNTDGGTTLRKRKNKKSKPEGGCTITLQLASKSFLTDIYKHYTVNGLVRKYDYYGSI